MIWSGTEMALTLGSGEAHFPISIQVMRLYDDEITSYESCLQYFPCHFRTELRMLYTMIYRCKQIIKKAGPWR